MPLLGRRTPLPPGEWRLLAFRRIIDRGKVGGVVTALERHVGATLGGLVILTQSVPGPRGFKTPLNYACTDSDVIENNIRAADPNGLQDCLTIDFQSMMTLRSDVGPTSATRRSVSDQVFSDVFAGLDKRGLITPATMVVGTLSLQRPDGYANMNAFYNPDLEGIPPDPSPLRSANEWAPSNLDRDRRRRAYVRRVRAETEEYRLRLMTAFESPADIPAPPMESNRPLRSVAPP